MWGGLNNPTQVSREGDCCHRVSTSSAAYPPALGQAGRCSYGWDPIREPGSPAQQRLSFQNRPGLARRTEVTIRPPPCGPRPARTDPARRGRPGLKPTPTRGRIRTAADAPPPEPCASAALGPWRPHLPAAADLGGGRGTEPVGSGTRRLRASAENANAEEAQRLSRAAATPGN